MLPFGPYRARLITRASVKICSQMSVFFRSGHFMILAKLRSNLKVKYGTCESFPAVALKSQVLKLGHSQIQTKPVRVKNRPTQRNKSGIFAKSEDIAGVEARVSRGIDERIFVHVVGMNRGWSQRRVNDLEILLQIEFLADRRGGRAFCGSPLFQALMGVKRTWIIAAHMSAFDPKRTCVAMNSGAK
jgi:hypothetical protein